MFSSKKFKGKASVEEEEGEGEEEVNDLVLPPPPLSLQTTSPLTVEGDPVVTIEIKENEPILAKGKISGTVTLEVTTEKMTRGVVVHCYGDAEVKFLTPPRIYLRYKNLKINPLEEYTSTEVFADAWQYLLGGPRVRQYKLTPGTQKLPFEFTLPKLVAASYVGKFGRIEYKIQVKIKGYGEKVKDQVTTVMFQVDSSVDLNTFQDAWKPLAIAAKETKKVGGLIRDGIIGFVLELPRAGMTVGETADFTGELVNTTSNWQVEGVEIKIFQSNLFAAGGEMTWDKTYLWETTCEGVDPGHINYWTGSLGPIPPVPPTNLGGCRIIRVTYWIQVSMIYRKPCSKKQHVLTEVGELIVGNVPFNDYLMEQYHLENERTRQHQALRSGIRYRPSLDDILGAEPTFSYFANIGDHVVKSEEEGSSSDDMFFQTL